MTLPQLPDLDLKIGLQNCMGKEAIYLRVLKAFRDHDIDFGPALRSALEEGRREDAIRIVHGLRASAGSIGATFISNAAHDIEQAIKQQGIDAHVLELVAQLEPRLTALTAGLKASLEP